MQVFNVSMKVLKRNLPSILIYLGIFLALSLLFASQSREQESQYASFDNLKINVAVFSEEDTPLIDGLMETLKETSYIIPLKDDLDIISDALYFRIVTYVLRIPEGFTESFMNGEEMKLVKQTIPGSINNIYTELAVNSYFNTARLYLSSGKVMTDEELVERTRSALAEKTPIDMKSSQVVQKDEYAKFYFNYMAYSLVSILVLGTSLIMLVWKDPDLYRRTAVSPLRRSSISFQKYLALGLFTLISWVVLTFAYFAVNKYAHLDQRLILHMVNSLIFAFTAMAMSFLVGTLLKSRNAISAVSNVVALGPSFISGVFVPQELLGQNVLNMAKVTPTYWYVTSNNIISSSGSLTGGTMETIYSNMLIIGLFGIGFFILATLAGRRARTAL